jgi:putative transposase
VFEQIPIYGEKKVHQQLLEGGYKVSLNTVARYRQEQGYINREQLIELAQPLAKNQYGQYLLRRAEEVN